MSGLIVSANYRGRLAPSPTGFLHLGHARTFWMAQERARLAGGTLILRSEDLDRSRCQVEFTLAAIEDLRWFGLKWQEGPDCGGPRAPYSQSERLEVYRTAFEELWGRGFVYGCTCSRQDVMRALQAPHDGEDEPVYPGTCRDKNLDRNTLPPDTKMNFRFRVPDGEKITFPDGGFGPQEFVAGRDFGDFVVWRHDDIPSYQLAVTVDDAAMGVTEVVRGQDLLRSTARQILLYRALGMPAPSFFHCPLITDEAGRRLAKRHVSQSLRSLRAAGRDPEELRRNWGNGVRN